MAQIVVEVPDDNLGRVTRAFCEVYGYRAELDGEPNPETADEFTRRMVANFVQQTVVAREKARAVEQAAAAAAEAGELGVA